MMAVLLVGTGGFVGAVARYLLSGIISARLSNLFGTALGAGTLFVNITGTFALALFLTWAANRANLSPNWRLLFASGFCGAYTTYSTFAYESVSSMTQGAWGGALGYMLVTNIGCLIAAALGMWVGSLI